MPGMIKAVFRKINLLQDGFLGGETLVREDLWGICFLEQTWDGGSLH